MRIYFLQVNIFVTSLFLNLTGGFLHTVMTRIQKVREFSYLLSLKHKTQRSYIWSAWPGLVAKAPPLAGATGFWPNNGDTSIKFTMCNGCKVLELESRVIIDTKNKCALMSQINDRIVEIKR